MYFLVESWIDELQKSTGKTEYIISILIDIREFSSYFRNIPSIQVATYVKRVFSKIMEYFPSVSYSKPLGDGILVVIAFNEKNQVQIINDAVSSCIELVNDFETFCAGAFMINFPVPTHIGIGVCMGEATCFDSGGKILDYSGTVLNLSSRLMNMARPGGIVITGDCGREVFENVLEEHFSFEQVYVRGISDSTPIDIHYQKNHVLIEELYKKPIKQLKWQVIEDELTVQDILSLQSDLHWTIPVKPQNEEGFILTVIGQSYENGVKQEGYDLFADFDLTSKDENGAHLMTYYNKGKRRSLKLKLDHFKNQINKDKIPDDEIFQFEIKYPV